MLEAESSSRTSAGSISTRFRLSGMCECRLMTLMTNPVRDKAGSDESLFDNQLILVHTYTIITHV